MYMYVYIYIYIYTCIYIYIYIYVSGLGHSMPGGLGVGLDGHGAHTANLRTNNYSGFLRL